MAVPLTTRVLSNSSFDDSVLAIGTCLILAAAPRLEWSPGRIAKLLLRRGENSYEIYLTHMFVVFACLEVFLRTGKALAGVPFYFPAVITLSAALGSAVARLYSEPANAWLRRRFQRPEF